MVGEPQRASSNTAAPFGAAQLEVENIHKAYGELPALRGVSLRVQPGAIICLLGPSGCGKSTLLRLIAGLETPDSGMIRSEGRPIEGVPAHRRGFGLMFQEYALFPHRNVADNVAFGLRMQRLPRPQIAQRVAEMLALVGLEGYDTRRVYELSGGERQRVALARSLAPSPRLLMLDEPLGALDRTLRERLQDELRAILKRVGVASIYVTHDQSEAFAIADWLVLMNAGLIEQQGRPEAVYRSPASVFAARFLGLANLVQGKVAGEQDGATLLETPLGRLLVTPRTGLPKGARVTAVLRPEAARVSVEAGGPNLLRGTLVERSFRGSRTRIAVRTSEAAPLEFDLDDGALPELGHPIALAIRPDAISVIPDVGSW